MTKSSSNVKSTEGTESVENMAEPERLAAISKVRGAYDALEPSFDRAETNRKRVKLLAIWRDLVEMREVDVSVGDQAALEAKMEDSIAAETATEEPIAAEVIFEAPIAEAPIAEAPVAEGLIVEEPVAETPNIEVLIAEVHSVPSLEAEVPVDIGLRNEDKEVVISSLSPVANHEPIVLSEIPAVIQPTELVISETVARDGSTKGPIRIRMKLLKPGFVHGTLLPEGTVVSTFAADAEELISSGTAQRLLVQNESEDDETNLSDL